MGNGREVLVGRLRSNLQEVAGYFDRSETEQSRAYAPGKWTMRELLVHLADTETVLLDRLRRLAADEKPMLQAFDQDHWAARLAYKQRNLKLCRQQFEAARESVIELLELLESGVDGRTGTHSEAGVQTFAQVAEKVYAHSAHHLDQLRACAAGKEWKPK